MIEQKQIDIDGTSIHYREAGTTGTPVVLVHGFLVHSGSWAETMPHLAEKHHVVALDLPGFGRSGYLPGQVGNFKRFAVLIDRFCEELGIERANLIGHSMGGAISLVASAMFPNRFSRSIFMDTPAYPFKGPLKARLPKIPILGSILFKKLYGWKMFNQYFSNDVFHDANNINLVLIRDFYNAFDTPDRRAYMHRILPAVTNGEEVAPFIKDVKQPVLLIWGAEDRLVPVDLGERLQQELGSARLEKVPGAGHEPHAEALPETMTLILDFLA